MIAACFSLAARNTAGADAQRLQVDEEHVPSFRHRIRADTVMSGKHNLNQPDSERRKLNCMAAVHQREGKEESRATKVTVRLNFTFEPRGSHE